MLLDVESGKPIVSADELRKAILDVPRRDGGQHSYDDTSLSFQCLAFSTAAEVDARIAVSVVLDATPEGQSRNKGSRRSLILGDLLTSNGRGVLRPSRKKEDDLS